MYDLDRRLGRLQRVVLSRRGRPDQTVPLAEVSTRVDEFVSRVARVEPDPRHVAAVAPPRVRVDAVRAEPDPARVYPDAPARVARGPARQVSKPPRRHERFRSTPRRRRWRQRSRRADSVPRRGKETSIPSFGYISHDSFLTFALSLSLSLSQTVPCTTYLVQPGFFDIFFPTDFEALREMYTLVMSQRPRTLAPLAQTTTATTTTTDTPRSLASPSSSSSPDLVVRDTLTPSPSPSAPRSRLSADFFSPHQHDSGTSLVVSSAAADTAAGRRRRKQQDELPGLGRSNQLQVVDHAEFLDRWAETDRTRTRDGSNPMIESYLNAKFLI